MAQILSAQEIEALLVERPAPPAERGAAVGMVAFSFEDPPPLAGAMEPLTETARRFAAEATRRLTGTLGREAVLTLHAVESLGRPSVSALCSNRVRVRLEAADGRQADFVLDADMALALIEARLGGNAAESQPKRPLTPVETRIVAGLAQAAVAPAAAACLASARAPAPALQCRCDAVAAETFAAVHFELQIALEGRAGAAHLLLPATRAIETVETPQSAGGGRGAPAELLGRLPIRVVARIPGGRIALGDLLRLTPGRVVRLDTPTHEAIEVLVNGRPALAGKLVRAESGAALEIDAWMPPESIKEPA